MGYKLLEPNIYQQCCLILDCKVHDHIDNTHHKHQMYNSNHDLRGKRQDKPNKQTIRFDGNLLCTKRTLRLSCSNVQSVVCMSIMNKICFNTCISNFMLM